MRAQVELESTAAKSHKQWCSLILAGLWALMAGVIFLLLIRTRSEAGRNLYGGMAAGVMVAVLAGNCAQELLYKHQSCNLRKEPRPRAVQMQPADDIE